MIGPLVVATSCICSLLSVSRIICIDLIQALHMRIGLVSFESKQGYNGWERLHKRA